MLTRKMGMLCDNLMAVQMINAKDGVVYVGRYINSDLLWGCFGGGGGNFGVVTSFIFKLYPILKVSI